MKARLTMRVTCALCLKVVDRRVDDVKSSKRRGLRIFCSQACVGIAKRRDDDAEKVRRLKVIWRTMLTRCYKEKSRAFHHYGGRGIKVCDRWRFGQDGMSGADCFMSDIGPRPSPEHTIDRIDNDGNYTPENCKWSTRIEQCQNTRRNRLVEYRGQVRTVSGWARELGIARHLIDQRRRRGWSIDRVMSSQMNPAA